MLKNRDTLKPFALSLYAPDFDGYSFCAVRNQWRHGYDIAKARLPNGTGVDQFLLSAEGNPPLMYCMAFSKETAGEEWPFVHRRRK